MKFGIQFLIPARADGRGPLFECIHVCRAGVKFNCCGALLNFTSINETKPKS